jgi:hypothetical protein
MTLEIIGNALVSCFIICCLVSAVLQVIAWTRHARAGHSANLRAIWKPENYFDEIGVRQMQLARKLLMLGTFAYLAFGGLLVASGILWASGS